jgi:dTDP-4-dehydrorhamnose reductase
MNLLITGASGFLGWTVCQVAAAKWQVYGTSHQRAVQVPQTTMVQVDLRDFQQVKAVFEQTQPDAVLHLAAMSSPNVCETQPEMSYEMNVTVAVTIAGLCADRSIPCAFTSTDLVFDGQHAPYIETDPVSPISRYGEQKAIAEVELAKIYPAIALCRMPLMFGEAPVHAASFLQPFIQTLRDGRELNLFIDEFRTPASSTAAAQGLLLALDKKVHGILHLGGKERISRYDFGRLMVEQLNLPAATLNAYRQADVKLAAPRPPDSSMDSSKAFALGYAPLSLAAELAALKGKV